MTHILTAREFADHCALSDHHSVDDYNMAEQIALAVEALKVDADNRAPLANLSRPQLAMAIGEVLTLLAMHEIAQESREGAFDES